MFPTRWFWCCGAVALAFCIGCSRDAERPARVPATGKVLYQGKPVEGAHVTFAPQDQGLSPAFGTTDAQGVFTLSTFDVEDGAQLGTYAVTVIKTVTEGGAGNSAPLNTGTPPPPPKTIDLLPPKYKSATTSGLSATVAEGGSNDFLFELK